LIFLRKIAEAEKGRGLNLTRRSRERGDRRRVAPQEIIGIVSTQKEAKAHPPLELRIPPSPLRKTTAGANGKISGRQTEPSIFSAVREEQICEALSAIEKATSFIEVWLASTGVARPSCGGRPVRTRKKVHPPKTHRGKKVKNPHAELKRRDSSNPLMRRKKQSFSRSGGKN